MARSYIIYDTEILDVLERGDPRFRTPQALTLTVACTLDHTGRKQHFYGNPDELTKMLTLFEAYEHVVSFNGIAFDNPLIDGCIGQMAGTLTRTLAQRKQLVDLMALIQQALGHRVSLAAIGAGLGIQKMGEGANAPLLWLAGKHQEVIDYCYGDCNITRAAYVSAAIDRFIPYVDKRGQRAFAHVSVGG